MSLGELVEFGDVIFGERLTSSLCVAFKRGCPPKVAFCIVHIGGPSHMRMNSMDLLNH